METPADITPGTPGDPAAEKLEIIDDAPDVVKMDLRKFNKTRQKISVAVSNVTSIIIINNKEGVDKMMLVLKEVDAVAKVVEAKRKELGDPYRLEVERINKYAKELVKDIEPAIKGGKALVLAFHKSEEDRLLQERTASRIEVLKASGMVPSSRMIGDKEVIDYSYEGGEKISGYQIEGLPDDIYFKMFTDLTEAHTLATLAVLEKEKDGADFFGESNAAAVVQEKIDKVVATPFPAASFSRGGSVVPVSTKGLTKRWIHELTDLSQVPREYLQLDEKKVREAIAAGVRSIAGIRIYQDESISLR